MTVYEFGRQLLETGDLDPVYVLVHNASMSTSVLYRWLIAYWCFYHVGTASWICDQPDYWKAMESAAGSKEWPRSSERRHFRGVAAIRSVAYLRSRGVDSLFSDLSDAGPTAAEVIAAVQGWVGFGPWIAFKVADMLERLAVRPVVFDLDTVLYDSPRKAASILWSFEGEPHSGFGNAVGEWAVGRLLSELGVYKAPPRYERYINAQEAETVLCKWGSYIKGHYQIGEDVAACRSGLLRFARCRISQELLKAGRVGGLWKC